MHFNFRLKSVFLAALSAAALVALPMAAAAQGVTAIKAGKLFDSKSGTMQPNQVIIVSGERITDVGPAASVKIPAGAKVIDLSFATVLPGLIDGHVHLTDGLADAHMELQKAVEADLNSGFTTVVAMGAHSNRGKFVGPWTDTDAAKLIDASKMTGSRIISAGPIVGQEIPAKTPDEFRKGIDELHAHGATHVKIVPNTTYSWDKAGKMSNTTVVTLDELKAAVDEAHKNGMWVATHSYGEGGLKFAIEAGVDDIQHAVAADDTDIKNIVAKKLAVTSTILDLRQDEFKDLPVFAPYSLFRTMHDTWLKMYKAGVILGFGSGATPVTNGGGRIFNETCNCSHGVQAEHLVVLNHWGVPPAYILKMATSVNAAIIKRDKDLGSIEKGKLADIIAVDNDPLQDITEMQTVRFVMQGGRVFKNTLVAKAPAANQTAER